MDFTIRKPFDGDFPITFRYGEAPEWYVKVAGYPHNGLDFAMPDRTLILACDSGLVSYADNVPDADGLGINLFHDWGLSQNWHFDELIARQGQYVKRGDPIGYSGRSGWATGPHLHFGIKDLKNPNPVMRGWADPLLYFESPPADPPPPDFPGRTYMVRPGDSLWLISAKFYGSGVHWRRIFEANQDKIKDPNKIYPLQVLRIPGQGLPENPDRG